MEPPVAGPSASRLRALLDRPAVQALLFAACYYALAGQKVANSPCVTVSSSPSRHSA